ncbi:hypothetical protein R8Z50_16870 [Longispora sp. K20-0274]
MRVPSFSDGVDAPRRAWSGHGGGHVATACAAVAARLFRWE